jgi:hypothetical protein
VEALPEINPKPTFVAVVLSLPQDGAPYQYFADSKDDLNVLSGPNLHLAIVDRYDENGGDNFAKLFMAEGKARYPGLLRADLPCLWIEDQDEGHFIVRLKSFTTDQTRDAVGQLIDCATKAKSAADLEAKFLAARTPVPQRPPDPSKEPEEPKSEKKQQEKTDDERKRKLEDASPLGVLRAAIKAVPAVRYALGAAGISAAAAIALAFFNSPGKAFVGTIAMFVMMILLAVFAVMVRAGGALMYPGIVLAWAMTLIFVSSMTLFVTTVFFKKPMSYPDFVGQFIPAKRVQTTIVVKDAAGHPLPEAKVGAKGETYVREGAANGDGSFLLDRIPESEHLVVTATAINFIEAKVTFPADDGQPTHAVVLVPTVKQPSPPTPASKPQGQVRAVTLTGTWQVQVSGDVNNARITDGTLRFDPQNTGLFLVVGNLRIDDLGVNFTGSASRTGSQVFLKFDATNTAGGSWSGKATFTLANNHLDGRFEAKGGTTIPLSLAYLKP